jgi:hypothetical protein
LICDGFDTKPPQRLRAAAVRMALVQARIDGDDGTEEEGARHQRWR